MNAALQHPLCVLNITDELQNEFEGAEYRKDLLTIMIFEDVATDILINHADVSIKGNALCFLTHFQPVVVTDLPEGRCTLIQFNADMFCIQKHDAEIGCNGILFNCMYEPPVLHITNEQLQQFRNILQQMHSEIAGRNTGSIDMLESYLKQFLVHAVRIKKAKGENRAKDVYAEHIRIMQLRQLIDKHYKEGRKLKFYADQLCLSESGLHKIIVKYTGKTFTELLYDKLLTDAKAQLFVTDDSIKEICYDLGFSDPAYFNRFFKKQCGITPEQYRQTIRNCTISV